MILNNLIFGALIADSTLIALLGSYEGNPAIFYDLLIPADCTAKEIINFYMVEPKEEGQEIEREAYNINCRANNFYLANTIANRVRTILNRKNPDSNSFSIVRILAGIPPEDETDLYNVPVYCRIKSRD